jgi:hypothetical protein
VHIIFLIGDVPSKFLFLPENVIGLGLNSVSSKHVLFLQVSFGVTREGGRIGELPKASLRASVNPFIGE